MTAWRIYAIVFSCVILLSGAGRVILFYKRPETISRMYLIAGLFGIIMIPGLLGYAYHQPHGPHLFWLVAVPIQILLNFNELFSPTMMEFKQKVGLLKMSLTILLMAAVGGPALYALIRYAFFSPPLWN